MMVIKLIKDKGEWVTNLNGMHHRFKTMQEATTFLNEAFPPEKSKKAPESKSSKG